ncbi:MAG: hypothetical protein ACRDCY_18050 [Aeromonas veronii]
MDVYNPMLAANVKPEDVQIGSILSVKLEGVRGQCYTTGLLTRQLKPFPTRQIYELMEPVEKFCSLYGVSLEGEFYVHGWPFDRIQSATRAEDNPDALQLEFHVFDCFVEEKPNATFKERYEYYRWAVQVLNANGVHFIHAVAQNEVAFTEEVIATYEQALENGYEGIVAKGDAPYKFGRSTLKQGFFLRSKPDDPFDGVIIDIVERQNNLLESEINELGYQFKRQDKDAKAGAGIAQTAIVYCPVLEDICRVSLTKGLQDYQDTKAGPSRQRFWEERESFIGQAIKFTGIPVKGQKPRSPRYHSLRHDLEPIYLMTPATEALHITFDAGDYVFDPAQPSKPCRLSQVDFFHCLLTNGQRLGKG